MTWVRHGSGSPPFLIGAGASGCAAKEIRDRQRCRGRNRGERRRHRHRVRTVGRRSHRRPGHLVVTNNGTKVTELTSYGPGGGVVDEVENILTRSRSATPRVELARTRDLQRWPASREWWAAVASGPTYVKGAGRATYRFRVIVSISKCRFARVTPAWDSVFTGSRLRAHFSALVVFIAGTAAVTGASVPLWLPASSSSCLALPMPLFPGSRSRRWAARSGNRSGSLEQGQNCILRRSTLAATAPTPTTPAQVVQ